MHRWLIRMLRYIDVRVLYAFTAIFVIPVCLFVNPSGAIIYRYFRKQHGYGPLKSALKTYQNHCQFSQVVIDKFATYAGKTFRMEIEGIEHFQQLAKGEESFVMLSSHIGNYEIAGYTLSSEQKPLNALVFFGEKASVMDNRAKLFADTNTRMIPIRPDMGHLFEIDQALQNGEIVSMPADRLLGSQKKLQIPFLNGTAAFPYGPFSIATLRGLNVLAIHVMKQSARTYKIYVTPLCYNREAPRQQQIQELAQQYVAEVQRIVKLYPTQWYNYFEFWTNDEC
ncbi:MAG: lysophospholipid acyltransferase family protein [Bacteroidaceae bacterium]|nr:lysophospholipid acyltransferase family protein [Bacteroidaceae bacterium]MBR1902162.1 lysophospholipid acyltransferase family protein [Bacteroidaceae bacterium]